MDHQWRFPLNSCSTVISERTEGSFGALGWITEETPRAKEKGAGGRCSWLRPKQSLLGEHQAHGWPEGAWGLKAVWLPPPLEHPSCTEEAGGGALGVDQQGGAGRAWLSVKVRDQVPCLQVQ